MRWLLLVVCFGVSVWAESAPAERFGFTGREIFPIDQQIGQLKAADLDGDQLTDLVVVNNARSKINLLMNRTGKTNSVDVKEARKRELNELPPDARFKLDSIASEKRISSMVVTDLNSDGRADLAYYGEPKELILQYHDGTNTWLAPKRIAVDDGMLDPYALVTGDLNGDKRMDLLLLAEGHIYFFAQNERKTFAEPEKIPYAGTVKSIQILDIQGDGRDDLLLVNWDNLNPFRFRLQNANGRLGPEAHFTLPPIRSYWADDLDGDRKTEVITIAQKSGRAQISNFVQKDAEKLLGDWAVGQFEIVPLAKTTKPRRGVLWADLNGDKHSDLLVAEPDSGQLTLYVQRGDGEFETPKSFPTLTGVSDLAAADWDGNGRTEIFMLSADERQIGVTELDQNGRIGFPKIESFPSRPLVMGVGKLMGDKESLAVIIDSDSTRNRRELQVRHSGGTTLKQGLGENFKASPLSISTHDADQDGKNDLVVLVPYEKIKILRQADGETFEEIDVTPPGGSADQPWLARADVDGDGKEELLLAQKNFLRAVVLEKEQSGNWGFRVKEQINGSASNSRIVAGGPLRREGEKIPAMFLLDAERKVLTVSERDDAGVWQIARNLPLPITDFNAMRAVSFGGTTEPDTVSLIGVNTVAWLSLHGKVWELATLDGYETPIKDGFLHDVVSGDLNEDQRKDLVFLETSKSYLDLVAFDEPQKLVPANRWQVFEERTFRSRRNDMPEPREALIADVTGDGKNDLIVVVHDRILVYPQE